MGKKAQTLDTLENWRSVVQRLIAQIVNWSEGEDWSVVTGEKEIDEPRFGVYRAPTARIRVGGGELHVEPIALDVRGAADGRVDLEAWPTLNRVKLLRKQGRWIVFTDSSVPLDASWGRDTYLRLARDLLA